MATPYIGSALSVALVTMIDSLVAGRSIGPEALAAVAATAPLISISEILHCLLGFGIDKLMIQEIGRGNRKAANRIFAIVLVAVAVVFALVYLLIIIFEEPILNLIQIDPSLQGAVIIYSRPLLFTMPLFEIFLCIERAFRVDGRAKLMASRALVTNIVNIILSVLFVSVLGFEIEGLAWASVIGTFIGYTVILSHFFSKKRTVSPDFSILLSPKEACVFLRDDIKLGISATLDEVFQSLLVFIQTAVVSSVGGVNGLAIWSIYMTLYNIVISIYNGISASVSLHAGLMLGEENYDGVRDSVKKGFQLMMLAGFIAAVLILLFPRWIAMFFCDSPDLVPLCTTCLSLGACIIPSVAPTVILSLYLPSVNRSRIAYGMILLQKSAFIVASSVSFILGFTWLFICYIIAGWLVALIQMLAIKHNGNWFVQEKNPRLIRAYSILLNPQSIVNVSNDIHNNSSQLFCKKSFAARIALVVEECLNNTLLKAQGKDVMADIDLCTQEEGIFIRIIDDGIAFNPFSDMSREERTDSDTDFLEESIILALSENVQYDRMIDLNHITLLIRNPENPDAVIPSV